MLLTVPTLEVLVLDSSPLCQSAILGTLSIASDERRMDAGSAGFVNSCFFTCLVACSCSQ